MSHLLAMLIVAVAPAWSTAGPGTKAVEVFRAGFDQDGDQDFDGWPDGWTRQKGPGYPHYVQIGLADEADAEGGRCLRIDLDGGAAAVFGPPVPIEPDYRYLLEGRVKTEGLVQDEAWLSITWLDAEQRPLGTDSSRRVTRTTGWEMLVLGPADAPQEAARFAVLGLHLAPATGQDIRGSACFDEVWLGRVPQFTLSANRPLHLYSPAERVEIACRVSGLESGQTSLRFELLDPLGAVVDQAEQPLATGQETKPGGRPRAQAGAAEQEQVDWRPQVPGVGHYRVRATMRLAGAAIDMRELTLAVLPREAQARAGEFGWTLPHGEGPVPIGSLAPWLGQAGINWVKFPLWHGEQDLKRAADLATLCERLESQHIELVGLLSEPPASVRAAFGEAASVPAADLFSAEPEVWQPSLELVMTPLSMKVRWWQLGTDKDVSFVGDLRLAQKLSAVQRELGRLGPDVRLGLGWNWLSQLPAAERPAWRFLALSAEPALTEEELAAYLPATPRGPAERWVTIEAPARGAYATPDRIAALVHISVAAKVHGADRIFIADPFDPRHGLLEADGTPGELFLPWRTTALSLAGGRYVGSAMLPGGSPNQVFSRGREAVMVVWNDAPGEETLCLGEGAVETDVWGRVHSALGEGERQTIEVGPLPRFVTGINEPLFRMAMSARFERQQLPSVFGEPHTNPLSLKNFFPQGAGGRMRVIAPPGWQVTPASAEFKLAADEELVQPLEFTFPYDADSGPQRVRVELEIAADQPYKFSIERTIEVGLGDVLIDASAMLDESGDLIVEQWVTNQTDELVSFKCDLFVPNRRRMRTQVWNLGRGVDVKRYTITDGRDLVGQTLWIRGQEIRGARVLSRRVTAVEEGRMTKDE